MPIPSRLISTEEELIGLVKNFFECNQGKSPLRLLVNGADSILNDPERLVGISNFKELEVWIAENQHLFFLDTLQIMLLPA